MEAIWNGKTIAGSNKTIVVEGNHYFPADAVNKDFLQKSDHSTVCHWKGTALDYDVTVDGKINKNAAWYYPNTSESAKPIEGYVAFWEGIEIKKGQDLNERYK